MMDRLLLGVVCLSLFSSIAIAGDAPEGVGDDDCVVFFGDKTAYPPGYGLIVENFVRTRYPNSRARYWHVGVPGDDFAPVEDLIAWFDDLVAPLKPTVIVVSSGLGDGQMQKPDEARLETAAIEFGKLLDRCQALGARVYVVTPPPPSVTRKRVLGAIRYDETVRRIGLNMARVAAEKNVPVIDWYGAIVKRQADGVTEDLTERDGLTPSGYSHSVVANELMAAWRLETLDATVTLSWKGRSASTTHGSAEVVEDSPTVVRLKLSDFPVPLRVGLDRNGQPEFASPGWLDRCRLVLKLEGIPDGQVTISEPGVKLGMLSLPAAAFRDGVNLAAGSPLTQNETATALTHGIATKNAAIQTIGFTMKQTRANPPEPEIMAAIEAFIAASRQYVTASETVIQRLPRTMDIELRIELESGGR